MSNYDRIGMNRDERKSVEEKIRWERQERAVCAWYSWSERVNDNSNHREQIEDSLFFFFSVRAVSFIP